MKRRTCAGPISVLEKSIVEAVADGRCEPGFAASWSPSIHPSGQSPPLLQQLPQEGEAAEELCYWCWETSLPWQSCPSSALNQAEGGVRSSSMKFKLLNPTQAWCPPFVTAESSLCTQSSTASWELVWRAGATGATRTLCRYLHAGGPAMAPAHFHCISTNTTFG